MAWSIRTQYANTVDNLYSLECGHCWLKEKGSKSDFHSLACLPSTVRSEQRQTRDPCDPHSHSLAGKLCLAQAEGMDSEINQYISAAYHSLRIGLTINRCSSTQHRNINISHASADDLFQIQVRYLSSYVCQISTVRSERRLTQYPCS